ELILHGARNLIYAVLFIVLGWSEPHGIWAALIIALMAAEVVVTLADFVEEDASRKLPASERVTHTLLALNYGALLALLIPVLVSRTALPTAFIPVHDGFMNGLAALVSLGVIVFGLRDVQAARRARRLVPRDAAELVQALPPRLHVLITGATG